MSTALSPALPLIRFLLSFLLTPTSLPAALNSDVPEVPEVPTGELPLSAKASSDTTGGGLSSADDAGVGDRARFPGLRRCSPLSAATFRKRSGWRRCGAWALACALRGGEGAAPSDEEEEAEGSRGAVEGRASVLMVGCLGRRRKRGMRSIIRLVSSWFLGL